ncbi:DegT/DnrJ/EryC1/StrS family aminotransferase [Adhaeretor mobilis]|uniref:dTDP-3-amino-3,6-dideoxy-alpha-D-galactopyranose transaminase n=1 Tax=Adhaeretor mobilis TaxID=1930276 RepID=A0A517MVU6_9BACT|nr:DegT/DnrJ/EryC1/StrS family aminotransferase [Adhaeretor mobilis]QDS99003.1 dTDP-3-amino-3,6-dideoxy-alpha-D-galactopyranose transaminase [Adhaeretor mobilis]
MATDLKKPVKKMELPSDQDSTGRDMGDDEMLLLGEAIASGTLTSTKGKFVKQLEEQFAQYLGVDHSHAVNSGTGALHTAVAAIDPEPGDEIITTSITDMGALTPIIYQSAIPVFADVCPSTYNVTPESIEAVISEKTKAIMVTHLFGNPCRMNEIMEIARARSIPVIEDCAQSFGATIDGRYVGTFGDIGCFSLQQGKHITTGEGGLVTSSDEALARRMYLFINKAWGYGDAKPDHYFLALNYRMNELTGAVAVAQLAKLAEFVSRRTEIAAAMTAGLSDLPGIHTPAIAEGMKHTFWKYCLRVESDKLKGGLDELAKRLKERGIFCGPRYIQKPAFECEVIRDQRTFGDSRFPFNLARPEAVDYSRDKFPGTYEALASVLVLPLNEKYESQHVDYVVQNIREVAHKLAK